MAVQGAVEEDMMGTSATAPGIRPARSGHAPTRGGTGEHLRLTARGRLTVFVSAVLVTLSAMVLAVAPSVIATDTRGEPTPVTEVTVQPGDTLWDIASAADPGADLTATVDEIAELNDLADGQLKVGQELLVPRY